MSLCSICNQDNCPFEIHFIKKEYEKMPNRFDYIKYDDKALNDQERFKALFVYLENEVNASLKSPRAKALVLTKLEEGYMWIGKAIRDDQIERNGKAELQEGRNDE
jgi:hypothetical protein